MNEFPCVSNLWHLTSIQIDTSLYNIRLNDSAAIQKREIQPQQQLFPPLIFS